MKFRLVFEGEIRPRRQSSLADIHSIRRQLHPQLKKLWSFQPLSGCSEMLQLPDSREDAKDNYKLLERVGDGTFAPLVSKVNDLFCELDIVFLRQQAPGQLISEGGDIDNRVKTLFDALRMPSPAEFTSLGNEAANDEWPMHCLLQDDALITRVSIETDRLLRDAPRYHMIAIINVTTRASRVTFGTIGFLA